jgi:hypothetical protein
VALAVTAFMGLENNAWHVEIAQKYLIETLTDIRLRLASPR